MFFLKMEVSQYLAFELWQLDVETSTPHMEDDAVAKNVEKLLGWK